jgi:hypothetical protein
MFILIQMTKNAKPFIIEKRLTKMRVRQIDDE